MQGIANCYAIIGQGDTRREEERGANRRDQYRQRKKTSSQGSAAAGIRGRHGVFFPHRALPGVAFRHA